MQVGEEKGADEETAFDDSLEFGFSVLVEVLVLLEVAFALMFVLLVALKLPALQENALQLACALWS